jgi:hypothetical protein
VNGHPLGCGGQVSRITDMFACIDWPTDISRMRWQETDELRVYGDDVEGSESTISR